MDDHRDLTETDRIDAITAFLSALRDPNKRPDSDIILWTIASILDSDSKIRKLDLTQQVREKLVEQGHDMTPWHDDKASVMACEVVLAGEGYFIYAGSRGIAHPLAEAAQEIGLPLMKEAGFVTDAPAGYATIGGSDNTESIVSQFLASLDSIYPTEAAPWGPPDPSTRRS